MYLCETELLEIELIICIKMDLAWNNLQRLICHKTNQPTSQPTNQPTNQPAINWNRKLSRKIELKKGLKTFQNIGCSFQNNSINSRFVILICKASRIWSLSLLISCVNKVVFSTRCACVRERVRVCVCV